MRVLKLFFILLIGSMIPTKVYASTDCTMTLAEVFVADNNFYIRRTGSGNFNGNVLFSGDFFSWAYSLPFERQRSASRS